MPEKYRVRQWHFRCRWHLAVSVIAATVAASRELICCRHVIENFVGQISTDVHIDQLVILRLRDFRTVEYYATATVHLPAFQMGRRSGWRGKFSATRISFRPPLWNRMIYHVACPKYVCFGHSCIHNPTSREEKCLYASIQRRQTLPRKLPKARSTFTNGSVTAGRSCFRIRRISRQCARPNWAIWLVCSRSLPSATPRLSG